MAVEESDQEAITEVEAEIQTLLTELDKLEFRRMFSGEMDEKQRLLGYSVWIGRHRSTRLGRNAP